MDGKDSQQTTTLGLKAYCNAMAYDPLEVPYPDEEDWKTQLARERMAVTTLLHGINTEETK